MQEAGLISGQIPLELFEPTPEMRSKAAELRAISAAPTSGTGVNVEPIHPAIFARSVLPRLGVAMPMTPSGTFSTMTVSTSLSAAARAKDTAATADAAVLTPKTTVPHRVSARLEINQEDILLIGVGNFESILRQNLMLALSDRLDHLGLTGDNTDPNPQGLYPQLTDPTDPTDVVDWEAFVAAAASGIDGGPGPRASKVSVCAPTLRRCARPRPPSRPDRGTDTPGEMSAAAYLRANTGRFFASARMPATASTIAGAILYRAATMGLEASTRSGPPPARSGTT